MSTSQKIKAEVQKDSVLSSTQYRDAMCLTSLVSRRELWNTLINDDKTQAIYFFHRRGLVKAHLT
jgi:hypothetical protein